MIVYGVCAVVQCVGAALRWAGSKPDADRALEDLLDEHGRGNVSDTTITRMEIPTHNKEAFLRWLNRRVVHEAEDIW